MLKCGIIGLPNVGKSTLFNALLKKQQAFVANYPFATIEPNIGIVPVPDSRLEVLARITAEEMLKPASQRGERVQDDNIKLPPIKPATVEFVDIAGLVKGASEGAGLGNKFLSHIREVSVIAHVVRAFADPNVIREGSVDVKSDFETITTELMLSDLQTVEKINLKKHESRIKNYEEVIERLKSELNRGVPARNVSLSEKEQEAIRDLFLLSAKPEIVVLNVSEESLKNAEQITQNYAEAQGVVKTQCIVISAKVESELAELSDDEQKEYLRDLSLEQSGLERLIQKAYQTLGLISFLTAGEKEVRAWTVRSGSTALEASGEIHTDFMKKFIKAEIVSFDDFVGNNGWKGSREAGKSRLEGRDYIIQDGDVVEFKIGS